MYPWMTSIHPIRNLLLGSTVATACLVSRDVRKILNIDEARSVRLSTDVGGADSCMVSLGAFVFILEIFERRKIYRAHDSLSKEDRYKHGWAMG